MTGLQGQIEENSYQEQANAALGEQGKANAEAKSAQTKGILGGVGSIVGFLGGFL